MIEMNQRGKVFALFCDSLYAFYLFRNKEREREREKMLY